MAMKVGYTTHIIQFYNRANQMYQLNEGRRYKTLLYSIYSCEFQNKHHFIHTLDVGIIFQLVPNTFLYVGIHFYVIVLFDFPIIQ